MTLVPTNPAPAPAKRNPNVGELPARVSRHRPRRDPNWMLHQLPGAMVGEGADLENDQAGFFARFVKIFQDVGSTLLDDADNIDHVIDVSVAPPELVRWLGEWVGVTGVDDLQEELLQRRIVRSAAQNLTWRGTMHGLTSHLRLVTGAKPEHVEVKDGGGVFAAGEAPDDPDWVELWVKELGLAGGAKELSELIDAIRDEIPAHVRARLYLGPDRELVWSTQRTDPVVHRPRATRPEETP